MEVKSKEDVKSFTDSEINLKNRSFLTLTGVEKVFETNENKIQIKVAGSNLVVFGSGLSVEKLDVTSGILEVSGQINELKYLESLNKTNFFKKIFK